MVAHLNTGKVIKGYSNLNQVVFFESMAEKVANICDLVIRENFRGTKQLIIDERETYKYYPKIVKAGYSIAIIDD